MKEMCCMWECLSGPFHYESDTIVQAIAPAQNKTEHKSFCWFSLVVAEYHFFFCLVVLEPAISEYITNIIRKGHYPENVWNPGYGTQDL